MQSPINILMQDGTLVALSQVSQGHPLLSDMRRVQLWAEFLIS